MELAGAAYARTISKPYQSFFTPFPEFIKSPELNIQPIYTCNSYIINNALRVTTLM